MKKILSTAVLLTAWGTVPTLSQTLTIPGEQVGLAIGAPLPEGVYGIYTYFYRTPNAPTTNPAGGLDVAASIPILIWSTPYVPLGGRIELLVAAPTLFTFGRNSAPTGLRDATVNVGSFVGGIWAFDLGGNFGVSFLGGAYLNDLNADRGVLVTHNGNFAGAPVLPGLSSNTYRAEISGSYTGDNYNLTASLTYNFFDSPGRFGGPNLAPFGNTRGPYYLSDALNLDLTATKKFDLFATGKAKFEFGAVGYGTVALHPGIGPVTVAANNAAISFPGNVVTRGGRFALGGLIGYDFGQFSVQAYAAHDIITQFTYTDVGGRRRDLENTEAAVRFIVPLYTPAVASNAAVVRKY